TRTAIVTIYKVRIWAGPPTKIRNELKPDGLRGERSNSMGTIRRCLQWRDTRSLMWRVRSKKAQASPRARQTETQIWLSHDIGADSPSFGSETWRPQSSNSRLRCV